MKTIILDFNSIDLTLGHIIYKYEDTFSNIVKKDFHDDVIQRFHIVLKDLPFANNGSKVEITCPFCYNKLKLWYSHRRIGTIVANAENKKSLKRLYKTKKVESAFYAIVFLLMVQWFTYFIFLGFYDFHLINLFSLTINGIISSMIIPIIYIFYNKKINNKLDKLIEEKKILVMDYNSTYGKVDDVIELHAMISGLQILDPIERSKHCIIIKHGGPYNRKLWMENDEENINDIKEVLYKGLTIPSIYLSDYLKLNSHYVEF